MFIFKDASLPAHVSSEVVTTWAAEFNINDLETVKITDEVREEMEEAPAPELSVVFKTDKPPQIEPVDKLFDKPYEVPHLQNAKVVKGKKKAKKRDRKKMDKFADMFDSAMNSMMDCEGDDSGMSDGSDL